MFRFLHRHVLGMGIVYHVSCSWSLTDIAQSFVSICGGVSWGPLGPQPPEVTKGVQKKKKKEGKDREKRGKEGKKGGKRKRALFNCKQGLQRCQIDRGRGWYEGNIFQPKLITYWAPLYVISWICPCIEDSV